MRVPAATIILILSACATVAQDFQPVADLAADPILGLVEQLGADDWDAREEASRDLVKEGDDSRDLVIDQLLSAYISHRDPEVRYRARTVLRALVDKHLFVEKKGFLGVSLQQITNPKTVDEQTVHPIAIRHVLPGHAAIEHGVKSNELIVKVDGRYTNIDKFPLNAVISYIKTRGPGSDVQLKIIGTDGKMRDVTIPLGARPADKNEPPIEEQKKLFFRDWLKDRTSALEGS